MEIPPDALVILIGPAGSGKSTFARRTFPHDAIISSDELRASLQPRGKKRRVDAFEAMLPIIERRLRDGQLTVLDATNTEWMRRNTMTQLARQHARPSVAMVFDVPLDECLTRNQGRPDGVPASVIRRQWAQLRQDLDRFDLEGYTAVHYIDKKSGVRAR